MPVKFDNQKNARMRVAVTPLILHCFTAIIIDTSWHHIIKTMSIEENSFQSEINDIMFALKQKYSPAGNIKEADLVLSTAEFLNKIQDHYPPASMMDESQCYELLKKYGYRYSAIGSDAKLQWLIKLV